MSINVCVCVAVVFVYSRFAASHVFVFLQNVSMTTTKRG